MKETPPYAPVLPAHDRDPAVRHARRERDRSTYEFAHAYQDEDGFGGVGLAASVPPADDFTAGYLAKVIGIEAKLLLSHTFGSVTGGGAAATGPRPTLSDALGLARIVGNRNVIMHHPRQAASRIAESYPADLSPYDGLFGMLGKPDIVARVHGTADVQDLAFAWQRLAGANPMALQGIRSIPSPAESDLQTHELDAAYARHRDHEWDLLAGRMPTVFDPGPADRLPGWFGVTDGHFKSVMGPDDSLALAASERRLYLADGRDVAGLVRGTWANGDLGVEWEKWIYPTLSLYAWKKGNDREPGRFLPVAIQCEQAGSNRHVWTPSDVFGGRWLAQLSNVPTATHKNSSTTSAEPTWSWKLQSWHAAATCPPTIRFGFCWSPISSSHCP